MIATVRIRRPCNGRLLVCEISEVTGETKATAEEQVDQALNAK